MMKFNISLLFVFFGLTPLFGQDSTKITDLKEVQINENRIFKRLNLYDSYSKDQTKNINGFTQLMIFESTMSDEIWSTENTACVAVNLKDDEKDKFLRLTWNKDQDGCDWVGLGFGWDFWSPKDVSTIINVAAIEFEVRSTDKDLTNLPWAMCFEDYSGGQAWLGFNRKFFVEDKITTDWSKVRIPLSLFPFDEKETDVFNIKQIIIQLFAEGTVEINRIELVPFSGKLRETVNANKLSDNNLHLDGDLSDWSTPFTPFGDGHSFATSHTNDSLYVAVKVLDSTPRLNKNTNGDLWKGDAIEFAFSTNPAANVKRQFYLLSDYHFGLNCGANPNLWSYSDNKALDPSLFKIKNTEAGYTVEMAIPLRLLMKTQIDQGLSLGFEIAIDESDDGIKRSQQKSWNSKNTEGFHTNPSLWGTILFQ